LKNIELQKLLFYHNITLHEKVLSLSLFEILNPRTGKFLIEIISTQSSIILFHERKDILIRYSHRQEWVQATFKNTTDTKKIYFYTESENRDYDITQEKDKRTEGKNRRERW
jgi:hypothetical protein